MIISCNVYSYKGFLRLRWTIFQKIQKFAKKTLLTRRDYTLTTFEYFFKNRKASMQLLGTYQIIGIHVFRGKNEFPTIIFMLVFDTLCKKEEHFCIIQQAFYSNTDSSDE